MYGQTIRFVIVKGPWQRFDILCIIFGHASVNSDGIVKLPELQIFILIHKVGGSGRSEHSKQFLLANIGIAVGIFGAYPCVIQYFWKILFGQMRLCVFQKSEAVWLLTIRCISNAELEFPLCPTSKRFLLSLLLGLGWFLFSLKAPFLKINIKKADGFFCFHLLVCAHSAVWEFESCHKAKKLFFHLNFCRLKNQSVKWRNPQFYRGFRGYIFFIASLWLPLLGSNQRHHD